LQATLLGTVVAEGMEAAACAMACREGARGMPRWKALAPEAIPGRSSERMMRQP